MVKDRPSFSNAEGANPFRSLYLSVQTEKVESRRKFFKTLTEATDLAKKLLAPQIQYARGPFQASLVRMEVVYQ